NGPREGGGFLTTPDSRMDDGILDFLVAGKVSRLNMLLLLPQVLAGTHLGNPAVRLVSTTRLSLACEADLCIQADGEFYCLPGDGVRQLDVQIVPGALELVVEQD
ncbi:MAG: sphingosine kinase, partial [Candidatus Thermoplasmatota archaeon]|nr:sphingosine kinase [Candidatus Thermoplasmatota archaeon]